MPRFNFPKTCAMQKHGKDFVREIPGGQRRVDTKWFRAGCWDAWLKVVFVNLRSVGPNFADRYKWSEITPYKWPKLNGWLVITPFITGWGPPCSNLGLFFWGGCLWIGIPWDEPHHEKRHHLGVNMFWLELFPFASKSPPFFPRPQKGNFWAKECRKRDVLKHPVTHRFRRGQAFPNQLLRRSPLWYVHCDQPWGPLLIAAIFQLPYKKWLRFPMFSRWAFFFTQRTPCCRKPQHIRILWSVKGSEGVECFFPRQQKKLLNGGGEGGCFPYGWFWRCFFWAVESIECPVDPVLYSDYFISHEIRIPSWTNQYVMECHVRFLLLFLNYWFKNWCLEPPTATYLLNAGTFELFDEMMLGRLFVLLGPLTFHGRTVKLPGCKSRNGPIPTNLSIGGGFKHFVFSPRSLGRWSNLSVFFRYRLKPATSSETE